ncbi:MAG: hypothetical protein HYR71_08440, partial [Chloroflexi bacterium]|nr:hypothetical protein [Chloroflexota bacterium]
MPSDNEFTPLEDALTRAGRERAYPPTPHIAARVRATLQAEPSRPSILAPRRFGLLAGFASAAAVLLLAAVGTIIVRDQLAATASPPRGKAYIANLLGGDLSVIALQNDSVERSIAVGKNPWGLAISPDGRRVYSAVDEGVAVVDTARGQRVDFVPTGFTLAKLGLSADGRTLLVSSPGGQMKLIDLPTQGTLDEFTLGVNPYDIKVEPTGRFAYVLGHGDGSLAV